MLYDARNNPDLTCIEVDDAPWSTIYWVNIDPWASFSEDCPTCISSLTNTYFDIYPNPANESINISGSETGTIEIINIQGKVIKSIDKSKERNSADISELSSGVYTLRIKTDRGIAIRKLIKQ